MTSVLRDSLGGNCKTVMVATVSVEGEQVPCCSFVCARVRSPSLRALSVCTRHPHLLGFPDFSRMLSRILRLNRLSTSLLLGFLYAMLIPMHAKCLQNHAMLAPAFLFRQVEESISTCKFAQRVALIKNSAVVNEDLDPTLMIARLKGELSTMREEVAYLRGEAGDGEKLDPDEVRKAMRA